MARLERFFPNIHSKPRVYDRPMLSGSIFFIAVICGGAKRPGTLVRRIPATIFGCVGVEWAVLHWFEHDREDGYIRPDDERSGVRGDGFNDVDYLRDWPQCVPHCDQRSKKWELRSHGPFDP